LEAVALSIATNLVSALMVAGSERLRVAALGDEQKQALEAAFTGATAAMLVEVARRAGLGRELPGRFEEQFGEFFGDRWVAEQLIGNALNSEVPQADRLRRRYEELGFDPEELPMGFERTMELFAHELALRLREDARAEGPLAGVVVVADVEAMRGMLEELVRGRDEKERELTEARRESLASREAAWAAYESGPEGSTDDVLFAGFFVPSGPDGRLAHGGNVRSMEASFLGVFSDTMAEHRLNSSGLALPGVELPIRALDHRPPEGFAEARDYEGFAELAGRWAQGCLGVVWGTLREDGKIERFEVAVDPSRYYGGPLYERGLERVRRVAEREDLPHRSVVRYLAKSLAAIWCQGYCDVLNRLRRWDEAIPVVADSERLLREALEELEEDAGAGERGVIDAQRRALLPQVIRQEAASLWYGGHRVRALDRLFEALKLDPLGPAGGRERFREYYNNRYAFSLASKYDDFDDFLAARYGDGARADEDRASAYAGRAFAGLPPFDLELFVDWISRAAKDGEDLTGRVDGWFSEIHSLHPDNPFVLLYWGDALNAVTTVRHGALMDRPEARLWDPVVNKYKKAYELDPRLEVAAVRAQGVLGPTAYPFRGTPEGDRRMSEALDLLGRGLPFFERYAPWALREGEGTAEDLGEWVEERDK
jgi:hypothetical protein